MHLDCTLQRIEVQGQHFFYRLDMTATEMFVISYDVSWFSHILLLVQIAVTNYILMTP